MKIEAFLLCWNERDIMPLVVKHYARFCDKITILDNHSTDGSQELAKELGCVVIPFGDKWFDDENNRQIKNEVWKESTADWIFCADFDEIPVPSEGNIQHEDKYFVPMTAFLSQQKASIIKTIGWQIMSDDMPKKDLLEVVNGFEFSNYAKNICFDPKRITEINFNPGSHRIDPKGNVSYSDETIHVLHYKHIGGVQRTIDRYREYQPRMSKNNRKFGWGKHYQRTPVSIREEWNQRMSISKPLI